MYRRGYLCRWMSNRAVQNYYQMLGVPTSASGQDIKNAYMALAKKYHPDFNQGNSEKFKIINEAYQVLSDTQKKLEYDQKYGYGSCRQEQQRWQDQQQFRKTQRSSQKDDQFFEDLRRMQQESMNQYRSFRARKEYQSQRRTQQEEELKKYYEGIKSGRYDYSERQGKVRNRQCYNPQFDRSKDSIIGSMGECIKGAWQMWLDLKNKK